jgi:hypothetical protein
MIQLLLGCLMFIFQGCFLQSKTITEIKRYSSPDGKTEAIVQRLESSDVKYVSLVTHTQSKILNSQTPIYFEKDWDGDIATEYEKVFHTQQWLNNQVFFVGFNDDYSRSNEYLVIKNDSSNLIDQIRITADGSHFIYAVDVRQEIKIPIGWVKRIAPFKGCRANVEVDFSNGTKILPGSNDFQFIQPKNTVSGCGSGEIHINDKDVKFKVLEQP